MARNGLISRVRLAQGAGTHRDLVDNLGQNEAEEPPAREAQPVAVGVERDALREVVGLIQTMRGAGVSDECILTVLERGLLPQRPELVAVFEQAKTATGLRRRWYRSSWVIGLAAAVGGALVGGVIMWAATRD